MKDGIICKYNKRAWLNSATSDSTSSIVAFNGEVSDIDTGKKYPQLFLEIADCHHKVRLHKTSDDTVDDFISKMKLLAHEINLFIDHLQKEEQSD